MDATSYYGVESLTLFVEPVSRWATSAVLASHGGNSIRTWSTENPQITAIEVLDNAHKNGVTVAMCIEIGRERLGFDYNDEEAVATQLEFARNEVMKYKDHPALLVWIIGNEVNLSFRNPKVFDAINDISKMIHETDPNHPTTTALAGFNPQQVKLVEARAPDLDFISTQMYGGIVGLKRAIKAAEYDGPLFVTEWGSIGHWEVGKTAWGAPIEQNSSEKAANYLKSYKASHCLELRPGYRFICVPVGPEARTHTHLVWHVFAGWVGNRNH